MVSIHQIEKELQLDCGQFGSPYLRHGCGQSRVHNLASRDIVTIQLQLIFHFLTPFKKLHNIKFSNPGRLK